MNKNTKFITFGLLTIATLSLAYANVTQEITQNRTKRMVLRRGRWPNNLVPYVFFPNEFTQDQMNLVKSAMNFIQKSNGDCLKFVPRNPDKHNDYILFRVSLKISSLNVCIQKI